MIKKLPKLTQNQLDVIMEVADFLSSRYRFGYYTKEDIQQEAFIIGAQAIPQYDENRGTSLKTFLYTHINNRLKNLKRDRFCCPTQFCEKCEEFGTLCATCENKLKQNAIKRNIINTVDIDAITNIDKESSMFEYMDPTIIMENDEVFSLIDKFLPISMRTDYLRIMDGDKVSKNRRMRVYAKIKEILQNNGYSE